MLNSLIDLNQGIDITFMDSLIMLAGALILGFINSFVYLKTQKRGTYKQSFVLTLVMLPAVICFIIMLVGTNVASAFSLAGAFSIIRFRSEPGNPKDITYILLSMAIGLACGMGYVLYAVIVLIIFAVVLIVFEFTNYAKIAENNQVLKITIPENLNFHDTFDQILDKFTTYNRLNLVKTKELGSLYELEYEIILINSMYTKEFIDELRCLNGNLNISLILANDNNLL